MIIWVDCSFNLSDIDVQRSADAITSSWVSVSHIPVGKQFPPPAEQQVSLRQPTGTDYLLLVCTSPTCSPRLPQTPGSAEHTLVLIAVKKQNKKVPPQSLVKHFQNRQFQRWTTDQKRRVTLRLSDVWERRANGFWTRFFDLDCLSAGVFCVSVPFMTHEPSKLLKKTLMWFEKQVFSLLREASLTLNKVTMMKSLIEPLLGANYSLSPGADPFPLLQSHWRCSGSDGRSALLVLSD